MSGEAAILVAERSSLDRWALGALFGRAGQARIVRGPQPHLTNPWSTRSQEELRSSGPLVHRTGQDFEGCTGDGARLCVCGPAIRLDS